jgi:hypothetical protein
MVFLLVMFCWDDRFLGVFESGQPVWLLWSCSRSNWTQLLSVSLMPLSVESLETQAVPALTSTQDTL